MANYDLTYEGSEVQKILDTGDELQNAGYIFRGEATPSTVPGTPTERVAYIGGPGTYTNFGSSITVGAGCICVFKYTGSAWSNQVINTGLDSAVNTLQSAITAINNNIGNGYVYAGVATPSTSPVTGKVFYLAVQAGTYTNFGNAVVTAGFNVIKYNGSAWSVDQLIAIDAEPTQGSANLVKSGGVLNSIIQNGSAFDISAYNAQGGVLATYADLSAALTALNALPADFKKGGMSFKFVLTSDNKYVQYRLTTQSFSIAPFNWQAIDYEATPCMKNGIDENNIHSPNGYWNTSNGGFVENSNYRAIDTYVPVVGGKTYYCWRSNSIGVISSTQYIVVCWYKDDKSFISGEKYATSHTAPANAAYMRLTYVYDPNYKYMITDAPETPTEYCSYSVDKRVLKSDILVNSDQIEGTTKFITYNISTAEEFISRMIEIMNTVADFPSEKCRYILKLSAGTYDINVSGRQDVYSYGLIVMPYVSIIGAGRNETILQYNYEGTSNTIMVNASGLNCPYTCYIENLTVEVRNIRYAIHSDNTTSGISTNDTEIHLKNVALIHNGFDEGKSPTYKAPAAWGAGVGNNIIRRFENCLFKAVEYTPWSCHNRQDNTKGGQIEFINCDFVSYQTNDDFAINYGSGSLNLISYGSHKKIYVNLINCRLNNHILLYVESTSVADRDVDFYVKADNEVFVVTSTTNDSNRHKNYSTGFCKEVYFTSSATMGSPIILSELNRGSVATASTPAASVYGILLHDVNAGEMGTVLYAGRFAQNRILGTTFASGQKIGWNGSSWIEDDNNPIFVALTSSIAKLVNSADESASIVTSLFDNALDQNDVYSTNGYWNYANGNFVENQNYRACNKYVPIKAGQTYSGWYFAPSAPTTAVKNANCSAVFYDKNKNYVGGGTRGEFTAPSNAVYMRNSFAIATEYNFMVIKGNSAPSEFKPYKVERNLAPDIKVPYLEEEIAKLDTKTDVAKGALDEYAITNDHSEFYVGSRKSNTPKLGETELILAINHDDFNLTDTIGTRKLYAKYGFAGNFNFILNPFATVAAKDNQVAAVRELLKCGNEIGFHAYFSTSSWWMDKMYDVRPDGTFTFAPLLSELKGSNGDGTGTNSFGDTITVSTKFNQIGFVDGGSNIAVASCTDAQYIELIKDYCVYFINYDKEGVDLDDNIVTKGVLAWAEYWYNNLIDNTLGYSSTETSQSSRFAEDYEVPTGASVDDYYPDAAHLLNGKMVFFDDTENPNYNNAEYQKVGRFKKGLFKGAASCCNFEITDRIILLAEAFCRHYFGMTRFTNFGRHGSRYAYKWWMEGSVPYDNREKTVLTNECQEVYRSRKGKFMSNLDILLSSGIKMTNHQNPIIPNFNGQIGLYYGQYEKKGPYWNVCTFPYGMTDFLTLLGYSAAEGNAFIPYNVVNSIIGNIPNVAKFAYENAGSVVGSNDGRDLYMTSYLRMVLNTIRASIGTGKIPALSLDTIADSPNTMFAVETLCQFCYRNDITIVPMEKAREIVTTRTRKSGGNLFPNPTFKQTLLKDFGGSSVDNEVYIPDGWNTRYGYKDSNVGINIQDITVDNVVYKEFNFTGNSITQRLYTRAFGLPAGKYKFTANVKSTNSGKMMHIALGKNEIAVNDGTTILSVDSNSTYTQVECMFEIQDTYDFQQNTAAAKYCLGYGNNIAFVQIQIVAENGQTTSMYNPRIELV